MNKLILSILPLLLLAFLIPQVSALTCTSVNTITAVGTATNVVPNGCYLANMKLYGAGGGSSTSTQDGGAGGFISANLIVIPGNTLYVIVGTGGSKNGGSNQGGGAAGGSSAGSGGGCTTVGISNGGIYQLYISQIVAAGGGGGDAGSSVAGTGGQGGGLIGGTGDGANPGGGGTQTAGGAAGNGANALAGGSFQGASGVTSAQAGGGCGYYGGGSGNDGAGGGSSWNSIGFGWMHVVNTGGAGSAGSGGSSAGGNGEVIISYYTISGTIPSISPYNKGEVSSSPVVFTSNWLSGAEPFTAKLYSSIGPACNSANTLVQTISGLTTPNVIFSAVTPSTPTYYCVYDTDALSTTQNSLTSEITQLPVFAMAYNSNFTESNTVIDVGQTVVANTMVSEGSFGPYSGQVTWIQTSANQVNNQVINTITFTTLAPYPPGIITFSLNGLLGYAPAFATGSSAQGNIVIFNTASNLVVNTIPNVGTPYQVFVNPIASANQAYIPDVSGNTGSILNTATNVITGTLPLVAGADGAFTPNGLQFWDAQLENSIVIINPTTNTVIGSVACPNPDCGSGFAINPNGTYAYAMTQFLSNNVVQYNILTQTIKSNFYAAKNPSDIEFVPNGKRYYIAAFGGTFQSFNVTTNNVIHSISGTGGCCFPNWITMNPSGTLAYVEGAAYDGGATKISVVNLQTDTVIQSVKFPNPNENGDAATMNPQGTEIYTTGGSTTSAVIGMIPETAVQELPPSGQFNFVLTATNTNTLTISFNGVSYTEQTGSNTVYGQWNLTAFAQDNGTNIYYYGSNSILAENTVTINPDMQPTITASNSPYIGPGSYVTFTANPNGGSSPYASYNFIVYNSVTYKQIANMLTTSSTWTWQVPSGIRAGVGNTVQANVIIIDGATTPETANSIPLASYLIANVLSTPTLTTTQILPATFYDGQTLNFQAYEQNGGLPYTYNFVVYNQNTNIEVANLITTANTFNYPLPVTEAGNTLVANVFVTDGENPAVMANSIQTGSFTVIIPPTPIIVPKGIVAIVPITVNDIISTGLAANTPILIGVKGYGYWQGSNIIGFNAKTYSGIESANMMNTEFFLANGMILTSWMEGNMINELSANGLATSNTVANALSQSANVLFWVLPPNTFLTGADTNIIYMGFAAVGTNLMGGPVGEAPQLSCDNGAGALSACKTYAQYDTGNLLFDQGGLIGGFYDNFTGTSLSTKWSSTHGGLGSIKAANMLTMNTIGTNALGLITASAHTGEPYVFSGLETPLTTTAFYWEIYFEGKGTTYSNCFSNGFGYGTFEGTAEPSYTWQCNAAGSVVNDITSITPKLPNVFSAYWVSSATANALYAYTTSVLNTNTNPTLGSEFFSLTMFPFAAGAATWGTQWVRATIPPPQGIMPNDTYGAVAVIPTVSISSASNAIVDAGQYETFTATITGGTPNYQYTFNAFNSITTSIGTNSQIFLTLADTSTWTYFVNSYESSNSPIGVNVVIIDTIPVETNSLTVTYTSNPDPITGLLTESNAVIDYGQYSRLSASATLGQSPYTYNWFSGAGCTGSSIGAGSTLLVNPSATAIYSFNVTDSASTPYSVCSTSNTVTVNSPLSNPTLSITNTLIDYGQFSSFTPSISGGTPNYIQNVIISNSVTNKVINSIQAYSVSGQQNTLYFPSWYAGNSLQVNVVIIDSASTNTMANSIYYYLGFNAIPLAGTILDSGQPIDNGQHIVLLSQGSSGTSPLSIEWYTGSSCNTDTGFSGISYAPSPTSTTTYTYEVTDSASTPYSVCSAGDTVTVNPTLTSTVEVSNTIVDQGQWVTLTGLLTGGTTPFTYNFLVLNSITLGSNIIASNLLIGSVATTNTFTVQTNTLWQSNSILDVSLNITDSAASPVTANSAFNTITVNPTLVSTLLTASNAVVDQNGWQLITTAVTGGTTSYTYNILVYNSGGLFTNELLVGSIATTNSFLFQTNTMWPTGTYTVNVFVTDSASTPVKVSNTLLTFTVDTALNANPPIPTNPTIDSGQSITLTSQPTGGSGTYTTYQWYTDANNNCLSLSIIIGATSSTYIASPTSNTYYCYVVTDSALGVATSSSPSNVVVSPALSATLLHPTVARYYDAGQTITISESTNGGTSPFSYNFLIYNSITNKQIGNSLINTNSFIWNIPLTAAGNTVYSNVFVTDSAYSPVTVNTVLSAVQTIFPALSTPTLSITNTLIDQGQFSTFTPTISGGSPNYVENIIISNAVTRKPINSIQVTASTGIANTIYFPSWYSANTLEVNIVITDNAVVSEIANSIYYYLGFNAVPTASLLTETNTVINSGQYSRISGSGSSGTSPLTINYFSQASCAGSSIGSGSSLLVNPMATNTYSFNVVDSATTPEVVCSASNTVTVNPSLSTPTITPSNPIYDENQAILLTANWAGGLTPYAANWLFYSGSSVLANALYSGITGTTNQISLATTLLGTGTFTTNVFVTDSASTPLTVNSILDTLTINSQLQAGAITPSSPTIDSGQTITLTSHPSGGSGSLSIEWYTGTSCNSPIGSGSTIGVSPTSTTTYTYEVTDQATTPEVVCSSPDTVTVNPALAWGTWISGGSVAINSPQTLSVNVVGGTPIYTYNIFIYNPSNILAFNYLVQNTIPSNIFTFTQSSPTGTWTANIIVTDGSSLGGQTITNSLTYSVIPTYLTPNIIISSPSNAIVDQGQFESFIATITNGAANYQYTFNAVNSINLASTNTFTITGQSSLTYLWTYYINQYDIANSPEQANVFTIDSHSSFANSIYSSQYKIFQALSSVSFHDPNPINVGQVQMLYANIIGGAPPYTYNYLVYNPQSILTYNYLVTNSIPGNEFAFVQNLPGGIWTADITVTDSATTNEIATNSITYTVNAPTLNTFNCNFASANIQISTSQIYQNNGIYGNVLTLYVTTNSYAIAYYGQTQSVTQKWSLQTSSITENLSNQLNVPPYYYFEIVGSNVIFSQICSSQSSSNGIPILTIPNLDAPQYSTTALILYALGILGFLGLIGFSFGIEKKYSSTLVMGIIGLALAFIIIIFLLVSLTYTNTYTTSGSIVNSPTSTASIGSQTVTTQTIASNHLMYVIAYGVIIISAIVGLIYFIFAAFAVWDERQRRRYTKT